MGMLQVLQYITTKSCLGAKDDDGDDEDMDGNQENGDKSKRPEMESETPWVSLASLALFKLFNDWQAQVCLEQNMLTFDFSSCSPLCISRLENPMGCC